MIVVAAVVGCAHVDHTKDREAWWQARLQEELRPGQSRQAVEAFLSVKNVPFSYAPSENAIYVLERTASSLIITTDLWVRIYFTDGNTVKEAKAQKMHTSL